MTPLGEHADTIATDDPAPGRAQAPRLRAAPGRRHPGLIDFAAERTTLWTGQGAFVGVLPGRGVGGYNQPLYYDQQGHGYKEDIRAVLGGLEPGQEVGPRQPQRAADPRGDTVAVPWRGQAAGVGPGPVRRADEDLNHLLGP
ncbi:MAG: hypothetical protein IPI92_17665 [Gemmatimonadetes bacterium]|nr:hypothetical protein [Gemmatimonadota bacterium]